MESEKPPSTPPSSPGEKSGSQHVLSDWLARILAYKGMYTCALSVFRVLSACIDLPLLIIPVICSTFNMSSNSYGTVPYFIINSFGAAVSVLHAIQKYFELHTRCKALSDSCDSLQSLVFDIQMFNVHLRHKTQDEVDNFMESVEQRLLEYTQKSECALLYSKEVHPRGRHLRRVIDIVTEPTPWWSSIQVTDGASATKIRTSLARTTTHTTTRGRKEGTIFTIKSCYERLVF
jgi:hypothetical protein